MFIEPGEILVGYLLARDSHSKWAPWKVKLTQRHGKQNYSIWSHYQPAFKQWTRENKLLPRPGLLHRIRFCLGVNAPLFTLQRPRNNALAQRSVLCYLSGDEFIVYMLDPFNYWQINLGLPHNGQTVSGFTASDDWPMIVHCAAPCVNRHDSHWYWLALLELSIVNW